MENHPIENLDHFVHSAIPPGTLLHATPEEINTYLAKSIVLKENVRRQLLRDILYCKAEKEAELLIEHHQIIVTDLLNNLFHYQHCESLNSGLKQFYQAVISELDAVIFFLHNNYGRYFNADLNLPLTLQLKEAHELEKQWTDIAKSLNESETDKRLLTILGGIIKGQLHLQEGTTITDHQVSYLKNLLKALSVYLSGTVLPQAYASITEQLISWKFNDFEFIQTVCTGISTEIEQEDSNETRLELLKNSQKQIGQILEKCHAAFHPAQPTAKEIILDWIDREIAYREEAVMVPEKKEVQEEVKIHTSLTVPVLALITRLFKDSGMVTNTNNMEIIRFFATHFTIQSKSAFSLVHLRSKFYEIDESTKKKVYDYLMVMAQLCKKL